MWCMCYQQPCEFVLPNLYFTSLPFEITEVSTRCGAFRAIAVVRTEICRSIASSCNIKCRWLKLSAQYPLCGLVLSSGNSTSKYKHHTKTITAGIYRRCAVDNVIEFGALLPGHIALSRERTPPFIGKADGFEPFNATFSAKRQVKVWQCSGAAFYNTAP